MEPYGDGEHSIRDHQEYAKLCALATSRTLSPAEYDRLQQHLTDCAECRSAYAQYRSLSKAVQLLAANDQAFEEDGTWDNTRARSRLLSEIARQPSSPEAFHPSWVRFGSRAAVSAMAACLLLALAVTAYWAGRIRMPDATPSAALEVERVRMGAAKRALEIQLTYEATARKLQDGITVRQTEIGKLQAVLNAAEIHLRDLSASNDSRTEQLRALAAERDRLGEELRSAQQAHQEVQEMLAQLREQRQEAARRTTSLEYEVQQLSKRLLEQDQALQERQQYLSADRDIRELMGARQLYIADVFDIDNNGRTRKPFGRIFYTRDKSLVFYAFDLDQGPKVRNAGSFQAWGRKDSGPERPLNLGVFYMDNEANRRWVLRFDDPAKLAEINAIFVTVEPQGGSSKPTSKPFLYASLRSIPNHP